MDIIQVTCKCGNQMDVPAEHAGKNIRCRGCKAVLRVPLKDGRRPSEHRHVEDRRIKKRRTPPPAKTKSSSERRADLERRTGKRRQVHEYGGRPSGRGRTAPRRRKSNIYNFLGIGALIAIGLVVLIVFFLNQGGTRKDLEERIDSFVAEWESTNNRFSAMMSHATQEDVKESGVARKSKEFKAALKTMKEIGMKAKTKVKYEIVEFDGAKSKVKFTATEDRFEGNKRTAKGRESAFEFQWKYVDEEKTWFIKPKQK